MPTQINILDELESLLKTAEAKVAKTANAPGVNSLPGAEHDQSTSVKPADPELTSMVPPGARTNAGAGDNSPLTRGQLKDSTQPPAPSPTTKPAISSDLGKTADLGNQILSDAAKAAAAAKKASELPVDRVNTDSEKPKEPKLKDSSEAPAPTPETKPAISAEGVKGAQAAQPKLELTPDIYQKIGMLVCSSDEGLNAVCGILEKQAGEQAAIEVMGKVAELQGQQAAASSDDAYLNAFLGRDGMTAEKLGQMAAEEAMAGAVQEGDAPPMEGGDAELVAALDQLVQEGSIQPDVAEALMQLAQSGQLQQMLGEAGGDAGAPPAPGAEGGLPPGAEGGLPPDAGAGGGLPPELAGAAGGAGGGGGMPPAMGGEAPSQAETTSGDQSEGKSEKPSSPLEDKGEKKEEKPDGEGASDKDAKTKAK